MILSKLAALASGFFGSSFNVKAVLAVLALFLTTLLSLTLYSLHCRQQVTLLRAQTAALAESNKLLRSERDVALAQVAMCMQNSMFEAELTLQNQQQKTALHQKYSNIQQEIAKILSTELAPTNIVPPKPTGAVYNNTGTERSDFGKTDTSFKSTIPPVAHAEFTKSSPAPSNTFAVPQNYSPLPFSVLALPAGQPLNMELSDEAYFKNWCNIILPAHAARLLSTAATTGNTPYATALPAAK